jgi:Subtilase family
MAHGLHEADECGLRPAEKRRAADTGCVDLKFVNASFDLTAKSSTVRVNPGTQTDVNGHGTAISTLIHEVAPHAVIKTVKITDKNPEYLHVLAGIAVAVADCEAEIVNLSMGFQSFGVECGACGATGLTRSIALEKMLTMLQTIKRSGLIGPIFVAAAGNHAGEFPHRPASPPCLSILSPQPPQIHSLSSAPLRRP